MRLIGVARRLAYVRRVFQDAENTRLLRGLELPIFPHDAPLGLSRRAAGCRRKRKIADRSVEIAGLESGGHTVWPVTAQAPGSAVAFYNRHRVTLLQVDINTGFALDPKDRLPLCPVGQEPQPTVAVTRGDLDKVAGEIRPGGRALRALSIAKRIGGMV